MGDHNLWSICVPFRPTITYRPTAIATSTLTQTLMGTREASAASHRRRSELAAVPANRMRETIIYETSIKTRKESLIAMRQTLLLDVVQGRARKLLMRMSSPTGSSITWILSPVSTSAITHLYLWQPEWSPRKLFTRASGSDIRYVLVSLIWRMLRIYKLL